MNSLDKTAYCGIFCPDCIRYENNFSELAGRLKEQLDKVEFHTYAAVETPFGANFSDYPTFMRLFTDLQDAQCCAPCRVGGGCSGVPCDIMKCCQSRGYEGCWECDDMEGCDKFDILTPRCGDMPKNNLRTIRKHTVENWESCRDPFYIWQK